MFPSEDEIHRAFEMGELEFARYLRLLEISRTGIDTSTTFLFDNIPNLSHFDYAPLQVPSDLETEQRDAFIETPRTEPRLIVRLHQGQQLEEDGRSRYRTSFTADVSRSVNLSMRINREYTGRERFVTRSLTFAPDSGVVKRIVLGSFVERFGLGAVLGYSGKRLDASTQLDRESFLYPDHGGFNGLLAHLDLARFDLRAVASHQRDNIYRLATAGLQFDRRFGRVALGLINVFSRLSRRDGGEAANDHKSSLFTRYRYRNGAVAAEFARQWQPAPDAAAVLEWRHRFERAGIRAAGWHYGEHYCGLLSGSKSGGLYRKVVLDDIDYEYSDRRSRQSGLLLRTAVDVTPRGKLINALQWAEQGTDSAETEFLSAFDVRLTEPWSARLEYGYEQDDRPPETATGRHRLRLEQRFAPDLWRIRTYIAYTRPRGDVTRGESEDYVSAFLRLRREFDNSGALELWAHAGRIRKGRLDYWYGYIRHTCTIYGNTEIACKLSHRYRRADHSHHDTEFSVEVTAGL
ncbi:hypothetical protein GF420_10810 [candidate division GN15 bacterium]|nr:hypothetical protein [candidate division GN15 bacterium]